MDTTLTITDVKNIMRRRAKLFVLVFSLLMVVTLVVALVLPPVFRSSSVILIEAQQIPDEYVKSTITSYAEQRFEMITRDIQRYKVLKEIIKEFNLYPDLVQRGDIGTAVGKMKESIGIEPISSKVGAKSYTVAFVLSYEGRDPKKTYAVADRLSSFFLRKEAETREKQAAATTGFLQSELTNLKKQIEEHEKKISQFKQQHIDNLPGSAAANVGTLQRLERDQEQINTRIRSLQDRTIYLKGQLANVEPLKPIQTESGQLAGNPEERLKTLRLELIRARSRLSDKHPDIIKMKNEIAQLEKQVGKGDATIVKVKQLNALRRELTEMKASKGERHPDVISLEKQIADLSKEVDGLLTNSSMSELSKEKPDNPAYISLRTQIVSADLEIKHLNEDLAKVTESIAQYQKRIENEPIVEREYNELTLDYQNAKARYNEVAGKLLQARVAQEMELQQQGEHFTITDPAYLPSRPAKPNRLAIILLGFLVAVASGISVVAFKEATDHTIKGSKDIAGIEGVDLLTSMPYTFTEEERRNRLFKRLALATVCVGLIGVVLIAVDQLVFPLNELFDLVIKRFTA